MKTVGPVTRHKSRRVDLSFAVRHDLASGNPSTSGCAVIQALFALWSVIPCVNIGIMRERREFLLAAGAGAAAISFAALVPVLAQQAKPNQRAVKPELANVKALAFDTFGTVVDWRSSVIAEG